MFECVTLIWLCPGLFSVAAEHKETCSESLRKLMQVFALDFFFKDNPLESVFSLEHSHRCVSCSVGHGCRCSQAEASREVKELSTMRALTIYCLAHHGQKNGRLHRQRAGFMQWQTMSQEEPILNSTRNVSFTVTHMDTPACASYAKIQEEWEFQTM